LLTCIFFIINFIYANIGKNKKKQPQDKQHPAPDFLAPAV